MIAAGRKPHLALELHNDGNGRLHVSRPPVPQLDRHLARMAIFEELLRSKTWFTEGQHQCRVPQQRHARRRLARALRHRRGRPRVQLQLDRRPEGYTSSRHWKDYGANLAEVFHDYFDRVKP